MRRPLVPILLLSVGLLAGCMGSEKPVSSDELRMQDTTWAERAVAWGEDHNHRNWTDHTGRSTPNFIELAHDPLEASEFRNETAGSYGCGGAAIRPDGMRISIIASLDTGLAFIIMDSTDPVHPRQLGEYSIDNSQTYDADLTPDGMHAVLGLNVDPKPPRPPVGEDAHSPVTTPAVSGLSDISAVSQDAAGQAAGPHSAVPRYTTPTLVPTPAPVPSLEERGTVLVHTSFHNACTGVTTQGPDRTLFGGANLLLVSLADPMNPVFEDVEPSPVIGVHSVSTALIDNVTYVATSITNLAHGASYYQFFRVERALSQFLDAPVLGYKLVLLSTVDAAQYGDNTDPIDGHLDAEISVHAATGKPVVYLSDWDGGLIILDFSIPAAPLMLGSWLDSDPDGGQFHSTRSVEGLHNGRHYLLGGQEFTGHPVNRPSGWIYVLDDTDPTDIHLVGRWTLPVDVDPEWKRVELYSTHYFRVVNDTAFVAMYHAGVWAVKLDWDHPEKMHTPPTVGVFIPADSPKGGRPADGGYELEPFVLDVFPFGNDLVIYDYMTGMYSVHYDASKDMTPPAPWPFEGRNI